MEIVILFTVLFVSFCALADKAVFGTEEWADHNINCCLGCSNNCKYCFARWNELCGPRLPRLNRIPDKDWENMRVRPKPTSLKDKKAREAKVLMFPTQHDITPEFLDHCIAYMEEAFKTLTARMLIVSKPRAECIQAICERFPQYKERILFRFTIGAYDDRILSAWEPNAPCFAERLWCLKMARDYGYQTSVSAEPLLDAVNVEGLYHLVLPHITDALWIGKLNYIKSRVQIREEGDLHLVEQIKAGQTDEMVKAIYEALKDRPQIKWKESYKKVVGIEVPTEKGLDI